MDHHLTTTEVSLIGINDTNETQELYPDEVLDHFDHRLVFKIYLEIYTILSLFCIAADVLIIYVILKYKRLQLEKSNVIILNWAICNILLMVFSPLVYRFGTDVIFMEIMYFETYCAVEQSEFVALLANMMLMLLMSFYWFLKLYASNKFQKYAKHILFYIIGCYVICLAFLGYSIHSCYNSIMPLGILEFVSFLMGCLYFLIMLILNIAHLCKRRKLQEDERKKVNSQFVISNVYFFNLITFFGVFLFLMLFRVSEGAFAIIFCTLILFTMSSALYFFAVLYKFDKDYNTFFKHVFSCRCRQYTGDEFVDQPIVYSNFRDNENRC